MMFNELKGQKEAVSMTMCLQRKGKTLKHSKRFLETEAVDYSRIFVFRGWEGGLGTKLPRKAKDECVHNYSTASSSYGCET